MGAKKKAQRLQNIKSQRKGGENVKNIVKQAIEATLRMGAEGQEWLEGIYQKVSYMGETGSYLPVSPEKVEEIIENAEWEIEAIHEGDRPSAILVAHGIEGFYAMKSLNDLPDKGILVVGKYHGDRPQLGTVCLDDPDTPTDELRAVCGTDKEGNGTFLITVFPGPNVDPKAIEVPEEFVGKTITVAEAKRLGASYCKVVTSSAAVAALAGY